MNQKDVIPLQHWIKHHPNERVRPVPSDAKTLVPARNKIQVWAMKNALTLLFMSFLTVVTWILLILVSYGIIGNG